MGSTPSDITQAEFAKSWRVSAVVDGLTVWENKDDPMHQLEEYSVHDYDEPVTHSLYKLRKASPYLVNAYSLHKDGFTLCDTAHEATKVFIEKIPLRLSNIKDIPYPDVLHLYDTCINGFGILTNTVGLFAVDEDFIGVNEQGQVRVWLSTAFENSSVLGGRDITQGHMLDGILELIHNATDQDSFPSNAPNLSDHLGIANNETTFDTVRQKFVDYVRQYNGGVVPLTLGCVHAVGGPHLVKDWCRNNSSFGFEQNSLRLSEKLYQSRQPSKVNLSHNQPQIIENKIEQPQYFQQYQPSYFNSQPNSIITPQFQSIQYDSRQDEQSIMRFNPAPENRVITYYSVTDPTNGQTTTVPDKILTYVRKPQPAFYTASTTPVYIPIQQYPVKKDILFEPAHESQAKLQQQRVISQTIEVKDNSRVQQTGFNNEPINLNIESHIATPINSASKIDILSKYIEPTYQNQNKSSLDIKNPQTAPVKTSNAEGDGKSSPQFLALLSTLINPKEKGEFSEVYSQVADTPSSYYAKENSSVSSGKKYFNYTNVHETYSQDAFSSFGQDSNKKIGSTITNNFPANNEEDGEADKYLGRYNFSKYDRQIDPELMADLKRYN